MTGTPKSNTPATDARLRATARPPRTTKSSPAACPDRDIAANTFAPALPSIMGAWSWANGHSVQSAHAAARAAEIR